MFKKSHLKEYLEGLKKKIDSMFDKAEWAKEANYEFEGHVIKVKAELLLNEFVTLTELLNKK